METPLFMALVFASLELVSSSRLVAAGVVMGLAVLTRHEGALFALPMTLHLLTENGRGWELRKRAHRAMHFSGGLVGLTAPWWVFAYSTFGTVLPHTLEAKFMPFAPLTYLGVSAREFPAEWFWSEGWNAVAAMRLSLWVAIGGLAVGGIWTLWKRRSAMLVVPAGAVLILGGLSLIGLGYLFRWHRLPVHYALFGVTLLGASRASSSM